MDLQPTDKKAIVTGSSRGIGRAIALELAGAGAHVLGAARRGLEPHRDRNSVQRRIARRATEGNDAMSEWIDFALYAFQIVLLWVLLPRQARPSPRFVAHGFNL